MTVLLFVFCLTIVHDYNTELLLPVELRLQAHNSLRQELHVAGHCVFLRSFIFSDDDRHLFLNPRFRSVLVIHVRSNLCDIRALLTLRIFVAEEELEHEEVGVTVAIQPR